MVDAQSWTQILLAQMFRDGPKQGSWVGEQRRKNVMEKRRALDLAWGAECEESLVWRMGALLAERLHVQRS